MRYQALVSRYITRPLDMQLRSIRLARYHVYTRHSLGL